MDHDYKMRLIIVIEGKSAEDLFAVGPVDLRDHFLPKFLNVDSADVRSIGFSQPTKYKDDFPLPVETKLHKDNFSNYGRTEVEGNNETI